MDGCLFTRQTLIIDETKSSKLIFFASPNIFFILLQVSWIRHSDLHILTVGRYTYTADNRYQSIYNPTTDEWILQVIISSTAMEIIIFCVFVFLRVK